MWQNQWINKCERVLSFTFVNIEARVNFLNGRLVYLPPTLKHVCVLVCMGASDYKNLCLNARRKGIKRGDRSEKERKTNIFEEHSLVLSRTKPFGHLRFVDTRTRLPEPSKLALSIFGDEPQSVQYITLEWKNKYQFNRHSVYTYISKYTHLILVAYSSKRD